MEKQVKVFMQDFTKWLVIMEGENAISIIKDKEKLKEYLNRYVKAYEDFATRLLSLDKAKYEEVKDKLCKSVYQSVNRRA